MSMQPRSPDDKQSFQNDVYPCNNSNLKLENDRFKIYDRCPMTDVAMAISTDADTDADVADLDHLVTS